MNLIIILGAATTLIGLVGLGVCIRRAAGVRRAPGDDAAARKQLNALVALNMASVGVAFFGLMLIVIGLLL